MSEAAILWIFGTIVTVQTVVISALGSALWGHVKECKLVHADLARIAANVERIKQDIGDHESGIRGQLHGAGGALQYLGLCQALVARHAGVELPPPPRALQ